MPVSTTSSTIVLRRLTFCAATKSVAAIGQSAWRALGHFALGVGHVEELDRPEAQRCGCQYRREALAAVVIAVDRIVVELAREGDLVFRGGQLLLQLLDVVVGLELRIGLDQGKYHARGLAEELLGDARQSRTPF